MEQEILQRLDNFGSTLKDLRDTNELLEKKLKENKGSHSDLQEKIEKIEKDLDTNQDKIEKQVHDLKIANENSKEKEGFVTLIKSTDEIGNETYKKAKITGDLDKASQDYKKAFTNYLKDGNNRDKLKEVADRILRDSTLNKDNCLIKKALLTGNEPSGGFLVMPEYSHKVIQRQYETSPLRQIADVKMVGSDVYEFPIDQEDTETEKVGEQTDREGDTKSFKLVTGKITVHELRAKPRVSLRTLEDAYFDVARYLRRKVADKFSRDENVEFIKGDGSAGATGLTVYKEVNKDKVTGIEVISTENSLKVSADDLITLQDHLFNFYQRNASFLMSRLAKSALRKLKDNQGNYLLVMNNFGKLNDLKRVFMLLGAPVHQMDDLPAPDRSGNYSANAKPIFYGDFKEGYCILDKVGLSVLVDPYTEEGWVHYKHRKRYGGGVTNGQAIKALKIKA